MSSVPSSADSCPARTSCLYMLTISCFCCTSRSRRASYPSVDASGAGLTFCVLATLSPFRTQSDCREEVLSSDGLAMIAHSGPNGEPAEELLIKHGPCQLVGEDHGTEGEDLAGGREDLRGEPQVGADSEGHGVGPLVLETGEEGGEPLGVEGLAAAVERDQVAGLGKGGEEGLPLGPLPARVLPGLPRPDRQVADRHEAGDPPAVVGADLLPARALVAAGPGDDELPACHPYI